MGSFARQANLETSTEGSGAYLLFMLSVSVLALAILGGEVVLDLEPASRQILDYADNVLCAVFFFDFCVSLWRAERKWQYFIHWGWLDLLSSIPTVDLLRSARLARIVRIFRVLRAVRAAKVLAEFILKRRAQNVLLTTALASLVLVVFASIGVLHVETSPDSNIKSPQDAIWWAIVTFTTVGYGDHYPVTPEGRVIAVLLMICGVALIGVFTGFVVYWFMQPIEGQNDERLNAMADEIERLRDSELSNLREEIKQLRLERDRLSLELSQRSQRPS